MPTLSFDRQQLAPQPALFVRRQASRPELPATIEEGIAKSRERAEALGLPSAGPPFVLYRERGPGRFKLEIGVPVDRPAPGDQEAEAGTLPGGPAAVAIHAGPYEQLPETFSALERWIGEQGLRTAGPPWESYRTSPDDSPDPAKWRTAVYWPVAE